MELATILSFVAVAALLVMSPGPNGVLIARTVPTSGKLAGFTNIAGFVTAFYLHGALVVFGVSVILVRSAELFFAVKMLGAAYLCWIGFKALRDAWRGTTVATNVQPAKRQRTLTKAFGEGLLTNALNPKVSMFYLAAFPQFLPPQIATPENIFTLVTAHSLINVAWFGAIVVIFAKLVQRARGGSFQRWLKATTGVVFMGFGAKLATVEP